MGVVMKLGVVLAVFWLDAAVAQEGYLGHDHDKWHRGFYQTLERPDTKSPCCNLTDCRPTSGRQVDGHYEVKVNGTWVSVPAGKILKQSAPDLGFHAGHSRLLLRCGGMGTRSQWCSSISPIRL
jgi:hypothetical protein